MQPESTSSTKGVQDKQNHPPFPKVPLINPQCCHLQLQLAREERELCPRVLAPTAPSLLLRESQLWEMAFSAKMFCGVFWGWLAEFSQQNRLIQSPARRSPSEMDGFDPIFKPSLPMTGKRISGSAGNSVASPNPGMVQVLASLAQVENLAGCCHCLGQQRVRGWFGF